MVHGKYGSKSGELPLVPLSDGVGEVIATGKSAAGAPRFPKRLVAGDAVRFSPESGGNAVGIQWKPDRFVRRLQGDVGISYPGAPASPDARWLQGDYQVFGRPGQRDTVRW